jgi:hypothetical protein
VSDIEALQERIAVLEARLASVEDVQAIQSLKSRYGQLADSRYGKDGVVPRPELERIADDLTALFSDDAVWDGGAGLGVCRGHEEIRARFLEPTLAFSWHYFVKPNIRVDGETARGTWDILAPCTNRDGRALWMSGVEEDEYVKRGGVWLHQSMKLEVVFMAPHDRGWAKRAAPSQSDGSSPSASSKEPSASSR